MVAGELGSSGLDQVEVFDFLQGWSNIWGVFRGSGNGPSLVFVGHLDTIHAEGWEQRWRGTELESPFSGAMVDGEMWGRRVADQKAGIASVAGALRAIREAGARPERDVIVAFVGDEESGQPGSGLSDGIKEMVRRMETGEIPGADFGGRHGRGRSGVHDRPRHQGHSGQPVGRMGAGLRAASTPRGPAGGQLAGGPCAGW